MPNPVLDRLLTQRAEQFSFIDQTLQRVEAEERDLVDAETANLAAARQRIGELDAQIDPLEAFEAMRGEHGDVVNRLPQPRQADSGPRPITVRGEAPQYRSAGEFMVDLLAARGVLERHGGTPDARALARVEQTRVPV